MTVLDTSPRKKIKLDFDFAPAELVEPPPEACDLCGALTPKWQFGGDTPKICFECRRECARSYTWTQSVPGWEQSKQLTTLATIITLLRREAYGKSARIDPGSAEPRRRYPRACV